MNHESRTDKLLKATDDMVLYSRSQNVIASLTYQSDLANIQSVSKLNCKITSFPITAAGDVNVTPAEGFFFFQTSAAETTGHDWLQLTATWPTLMLKKAPVSAEGKVLQSATLTSFTL